MNFCNEIYIFLPRLLFGNSGWRWNIQRCIRQLKSPLTSDERKNTFQSWVRGGLWVVTSDRIIELCPTSKSISTIYIQINTSTFFIYFREKQLTSLTSSWSLILVFYQSKNKCFFTVKITSNDVNKPLKHSVMFFILKKNKLFAYIIDSE